MILVFECESFKKLVTASAGVSSKSEIADATFMICKIAAIKQTRRINQRLIEV